jgi:hypothetical protein
LGGAGSERRQLFGEGGESFVIEVGTGHVDQPGGLLLNGIHHPRMAVSGGDYCDAGVEVEENGCRRRLE